MHGIKIKKVYSYVNEFEAAQNTDKNGTKIKTYGQKKLVNR
jgi:hypothetical protein